MKVRCVLPNVLGFTGDAVNERQLVEAMSRLADVETYSFITIAGLRSLRDKTHLSRVRHETNLRLLLPLFGYPYTLAFFLQLFWAFVLAVYVTLKRVELIYVRSSPLALPFLWLKRLHGARVVVKVPAIVEDEVVGESGPLRASRLDRGMFRWLSYLADRYVMAKANAVAVPSPLMFVQLAKSRRISTRNILIIPAAISLKKVQKARQAIELENRRNFKEFTLGFVGILEWWQGVEALVRAVHKLQSTGLACRLVIVGDGPQRKAVEELCRTLNVNCLITGFIPHEEALKLMSQFDVLVLPRERTSTTESVVPLKVIEAWALGVPVVVTRHKIFELLGLRDGEDVVYCEPTPESVAQAVRRVLESEHLRDKLRRRGPQLAERFDYDTIAKRLLNTS